MTACSCLKTMPMTDTVLKAKQITFDTSILKHTVMKLLAKSEAPFICPHINNQCSHCATDALAQSFQRFETRSKTKRKSA